MSEEKLTASLPKAYDPAVTEQDLYREWEEAGCFKADPLSEKTPYTIVIPPPNVTGKLTVGHVLNNTLQDILIRYHRMKGEEAFWLPGTDHAGIATQNVVERELATKKITRHDLGREKFLEHVWNWKEKYGGIILKQLRRLGCSCDWTAERFTMDEGLSDAFKNCFVKLYYDGLIYKGKYIINWCPRCKTALSDEEKIPQDTKGSLWHIKYPFKDGSGYLIVATTRPETMLGDTAVAVHPDDPRYKDLIGKSILLPLMNREIPLIADEYVDKDFGSGAVKMTPAHDPNDFEIGKRHNLEQIVVIDESGIMNENAGQFKGLDRFKAREAVIAALEEQGLLEKIEPHELAVGHCERCKTVIEPYLSEQWFVKMKPLAEPAIKAYKDGTLSFVPDRWGSVYLHWMENIRDWCISRQLWWGHQIPAYTCSKCSHVQVAENAPEKCSKCGASQEFIEQDSDVLDTWFSSWLWPFSTMGWPEKTPMLDKFYPTTALVTGPDIIFFWVARMVMAGYYFTGECPFDSVYFTSIIRDLKGRKMSKSLGNSPDPIDIMDEYGADALRYTMVALAPIGQDVRFAAEQCEMGRNFANKLWNAARFVLMNVEDMELSVLEDYPENLFETDRWIISRLHSTIAHVEHCLKPTEYRFNDAIKSIYEFVWNDFCDWYLEISKKALYGSDADLKRNTALVLLKVLDSALKVLHPFMPFVTETLWRKIPGNSGFLMTGSFPEYDASLVSPETEEKVGKMMQFVRTVRNLRASANVPPSRKVTVRAVASDLNNAVVENFGDLVKSLAGVEHLEIADSKPEGHLVGLVDSSVVCMELKGLIDVEKELARVEKEIENTEKSMSKIAGKLENKQFIERAPADIVEKVKEDVEVYKQQLEKLYEYKNEIGSI